MIKYCCFFLLLLYTAFASAQYTNIINSSRPGFAETPFSIGTGVTQIEAGFQHSSADNFLENTTLKSNTFNQTLRFGAWSEKLEFKFLFDQGFNKLNSKLNSSYGSSIGGSLGAGVKFLVFDPKNKIKTEEIRSWRKRTGPRWKKHLPYIAISTSVSFGLDPRVKENINISLSNISSLEDFSNVETILNERGNIKLGLLLQNHIKEHWVIVSNFTYERRFFEESNGSNICNIIVAGTYNYNKKWSFFGENKNVFNAYQNNYDLRIGAVYLLNNNIQFDTSINRNIGNTHNTSGISLGFSWRLDEHVDKPLKIKKIKVKKIKDTIRKEPFLKKAGQRTKEFFIVAGLNLGEFFDNAGTDISIFTQNLFLAKENHKPKRIRNKKYKKEVIPQAKKPSKSRILRRETKDYKSGKTGKENRKLEVKSEDEKLKAAIERKKTEDKELELYEKAVLEKEALAKAKSENEKIIAEEKAVLEKEALAKAKAEKEKIIAEEKAVLEKEALAKAKAEKEKIIAKEKAVLEKEALAKTKAEKKAEKKEKKRLKKEAKERKEQERIATEKKEKERELMRRIDEISTF
jgi:hypothetical protein